MIRPWAAASLAGSLVAICAGLAVAQPARAIVTGRVVDAATGEPLPGVQLTAGTTVAFTDEAGGFVLDLPPGAVTLVVEAAYVRAARVELTLAPGEQRALDVPVDVDLDTGETLEVVDTAPLVPGRTTIDARAAARQAGTGGDALKAVQDAPGVARTAAGTREIVVWGAAPQDTAILVDDVPVPALYHLGGWRSIVPTELVATLAVDRAGFATPWSGAIGGLVRVATADLPAGRAITIASDFIDTGVVATGQVGPARVAAAARASYLDRVVGEAIDPEVAERIPIPRWADAQLVAQVPLGRDRLDVLVLAAGDRLERTLPSMDPAATKSDDRAQDFARASIAWRRPLDDGEARLRAWVGVDRDDRDQRFGAVPARLHQRTRAAGARAERRTTAGPVVLLLGLDASWSHAKLARDGSLSIPTREGDLSVWGQPPGDDVASDTWSAQTGDAGVYAQADWVHRGLTVSPGLRTDAWLLTASRLTPKVASTPGIGYQHGHVTVDPRIAATFRHGRYAVGGAAGVHHQPRRADDTSAVFGAPTLGLERAYHLTATVAVRVGAADLELTGWRRRLQDLVAREPSATPPLAATLTQDGRGRALGLELVARLRGWRGLSGWIAYGLSHSERRDHDLRPWREFEHDQTHQLTVAATWQHGRWSASTRARFATGAPRTDVVAAFWDTRAGRYQPVTGPIYGIRLPDFAQLDVRGERSLALGGTELAAFVELENVLGRANAEELVWSGDYATRGYLSGLPFLVLAGVRWTR